MPRIDLTLALAATLGAAAAPALAQGERLPVPDAAFTGQVGRTFRDSIPATLPVSVKAPAGAPNIVVVLLDDAGFGQYATFGGGIPSPTLEALARQGLRYNRFHTAGICSPTRAALLTGRNPHEAGYGIVAELATGYDGYTGVIPQSTATVAEVLRDNGYATAMIGKNHNTPPLEAGAAGPFNHWPNAMGFEYFYGFNAWGTSQWQPLLFENTRPVAPSSDPDYFLTTDLVDHALTWIRSETSAAPEKPYFLYLATGATHAPHHAPRAWIDRFKGRFDEGWDKYRQETFDRQKRLGVIPADAELTPRPNEVPAWDSLSPEKRAIAAHEMEVFAGYAAQADDQIGRLVKAIRALPGGDNTLIVFIAGDNGASAEGGFEGTLNELAPSNGLERQSQPTAAQADGLGGPRYMNHFAIGWAWAMNTPFRYYKQVVSHLGAIRNPLVVSWPARIKDAGGLRSQFFDIVDIAPTLYAAAGVKAPVSVNGVTQKPVDGISMLPSMESATAPEVRLTQYFEVFGNRGIYDRGWFASAKLADPWRPDRASLDPDKVTWELYDLDADFTQAHDLAAQHPDKLQAMKDLWWAEAGRNNVLPLDWRAAERLGARKADPRTRFTFDPGMVDLPEGAAPSIRNRSWTMTASGDFQPDDQGMLITQGGVSGGWAFYVRGGRLCFDYNYGAIQRFHLIADVPVPRGAKSLEARFDYDGVAGKDVGKGGTLTFFADGAKLGVGRLPATVRGLFAVNEGMDVGADYGSPVGDYPMPFAFAGKLESVRIDLR